VENEIRAAMADAEAALYAGERVATWKAHQRRSIDLDALRAAHPLIAEQFTKSEPVRTLRVPARKGQP
jgi:hypothetical protein